MARGATRGTASAGSTAQRKHLVGLGLISLYLIISSVSAVYVGNLGQSVDAMLMVFVTFALTAGFFNVTQLGDLRAYFKVVRGALGDVVWLNLFTIGSWVGYYVSLSALEPAVAEALILGLGPLATLVISKLFRRDAAVLRSDLIASLGILLTTVFLTVVILHGKSAVGAIDTYDAVVGIIWAVVAGATTSGTLVFSKRLYDRGFTASQVMACRFWLLLAGSLVYVLVTRPPLEPMIDRMWLVLLLVVLGLISLFFAQKGVEKADPIAVSLVFSLGPMSVFAIQQADARLAFSLLSLIGISVVVAFVLWGSNQRYRSLAPTPTP